MTTPAIGSRPIPNGIRAPTQAEREAAYTSYINAHEAEGVCVPAPTETQLKGLTAFRFRDGANAIVGNKTMFIIKGELFLKTVPTNQKVPEPVWQSFGKPRINF